MCSITSSASTIRADATRPSATSVRYSSRRLKKLRFVSTEPAAGHEGVSGGMGEYARHGFSADAVSVKDSGKLGGVCLGGGRDSQRCARSGCQLVQPHIEIVTDK